MDVLGPARLTPQQTLLSKYIYSGQQKGLRRALLICFKALDYLKLTLADTIDTLPR